MSTTTDARHGVRAEYLAGCRCEPCTRAHSRYMKAYKTRREGTGRMVRVDSGPALQHITYLREHMSLSAIAAAAGTSEACVFDIAAGRRATIHPRTHTAILEVQGPPEHGNHRRAPTGALRRVRALQAIGWSYQAIGEASGISAEYLADLANRPPGMVEKQTADAITTAYELLSTSTPVPRNPQHAGGITRTRAAAKAAGWLPPTVWDDPDTDTGPQKPTNPVDDRLDDLRMMAASGEHYERAARRLGITTKALLDWCYRNGQHDLARSLGAPGKRTNFLSG